MYAPPFFLAKIHTLGMYCYAMLYLCQTTLSFTLLSFVLSTLMFFDLKFECFFRFECVYYFEHCSWMHRNCNSHMTYWLCLPLQKAHRWKDVILSKRSKGPRKRKTLEKEKESNESQNAVGQSVTPNNIEEERISHFQFIMLLLRYFNFNYFVFFAQNFHERFTKKKNSPAFQNWRSTKQISPRISEG